MFHNKNNTHSEPMKKNWINRTIAIALWIAVAAFFLQEYRFFAKARDIHFEEAARDKLKNAAERLDTTFRMARMLSGNISTGLSEPDSLNKKYIKELMKKYCSRYPIDGLFFALENVGNGNRSESYAIVMEKEKEFMYSEIDDFYTLENTGLYKKWYTETLKKDTAIWRGPVYDDLLGTRIIACCVPIYPENGRKKGMVAVIYRTSLFYKRIHHMGLSRYGLPYIMDSSTHFVAHPLDEVRSLRELAKENDDLTLLEMSDDIKLGKLFSKDYIHVNTVTQKICNEVFHPLKETSWFFGLSVYNGYSLESATYHKAMKQSYIRLILYALFFVLILLTFMGNEISKFQYSVYYYAAFPLLFFVGIAMIIGAYNRYPFHKKTSVLTENNTNFEQIKIAKENQTFLDNQKIYNKWDPTRIVDIQSLNIFLDNYRNESCETQSEPVKIIPTGIYLNSLQFLSSYELKMTGFCWQKFLTADVPHSKELLNTYHLSDYDKAGVIFPGSTVNTYELVDSLPILLEGEAGILYRWKFDIEITQHLSYALYPFGKNNIVLPIWSTGLDDNTLLTPDLNAYKQLYPDVCPGLANNFYINGWNVYSTFFSYSLESYLCDFGNAEIIGSNRFPELMFNIDISRKFIDIVVCKIIPLLVVLVLLFTILFVRDDDDGFNNIIGCSGLFFVLVFDHINLRETIMSDSIMYLEYCYFFTYLLLLVITVTSFHVETNSKIKQYYQWADKSLKKFFWAVIFGMMLMATVLIFY